MEYVLMDSVYYVAPKTLEERNGMFFTFSEEKTNVVVQYAEFHTVPGHYLLPFGEGTFAVSKNQTVTMRTCYNGHDYKHGNNILRNKSGLGIVRLGWFHLVCGHIPFS